MKLLYLVLGCCVAVCALELVRRTVWLWRSLSQRKRVGNLMQAVGAAAYASWMLLLQKGVWWDPFPVFIAGWIVWFAGTLIGAPDEWRKPIRFPRFRRR